MKKYAFFYSLVFLFLYSCSTDESSSTPSSTSFDTPSSSSGGIAYGEYLIDRRDNKIYKTVIIGIQTWMAWNLNYNFPGSKCGGEEYALEDENNIYCDTYGRLYNWETATNICPYGWHLPSDEEWAILENNAGILTAGIKLKAKTGWDNNCNGTDDYGFSAFPGGIGNPLHSHYKFEKVGKISAWWSATEDKFISDMAYAKEISCRDDISYAVSYGKIYTLSIRCVKD